jgi:hypothetical protein
VLSTVSGVYTDPAMITAGSTVFLDAAWLNNGQTTTSSTSFATQFFKGGVNLGAPTTAFNMNPGDGVHIVDANIGTITAGFTEMKMLIDSTSTIGESTETNNNFIRTYVIDSTPNRAYTLRLDPVTPTNVQVLINGVASYTVAKSALNGILFYLSGANESLTIDATNGNPIPFNYGVVANVSFASDTISVIGTGGNDSISVSPDTISFNGTSVSYRGEGTVTVNPAGGTDALTIAAGTGTNNISVNATQVNFNSLLVPYSNLETLRITGDTGNDTVTQTAQPGATLSIALDGGTNTFNLNAGTFTFTSDAKTGSPNLTVNLASGTSLVMNATQHFTALNINNALATLSSGGNKVLVTPSLTFAGTGALDLTDGDAIITGGSLSGIQTQVTSGYSGGTWTGNGIRSSTAASVATNGSILNKTGLGYAVASSVGAGPTFDGQTIGGSDVLIRYTDYGDANLDGSVDTIDFSSLSANFNGTSKVWASGDFDFSSNVNAIDFNNMATNFGQLLPAPPVASLFSVTQIPAGSSMDSLALRGYKLPNRPVGSNGLDDLEAELTL